MSETKSTHSPMLAAPRVLTGDNPFGLPPEADHLGVPDHSRPLWSETMFFLVWSPEHKVGIWLHMGVVLEDKIMWWAQTFALLPDGVVLVDRSYGRPADDRGPDTGNLKVRCEEPHKRWTLTFDGAGEVSSTEALARNVTGAGIARPFKFSIELEAIVPIYDMHAAMGDEIDWNMGSIHHEQGLRATGELSALGENWQIDGIGIRDHSRGERAFTHWGGHVWNYVVWPESRRVLCAMNMWSPEKEPQTAVVMIMEDGQTEICSYSDVTGMHAPGGDPNDITMRIQRVDGSILELSGEVLHNVTMTYVEPNQNLNGACFTPPGDVAAMVADESVVRWTWPDGEAGYSNLERGFRPDLLPLTSIPQPISSPFHSPHA